jgi:putative oxidoreductase
MLIAGALTRFAGLMLLVDMVVAASTVHIRHGFFLPSGFEYTFTLGLISLALILTGAGLFSIDALFSRPTPVEQREYRVAA